MIIRIVKMEFKKEFIGEFKSLFEERKERIRNFEGCIHLELLQGIEARNNVFVTYSKWNSEEALNHYRYSSLFKETWSKTKSMFAKKAEATSFVQLHKLD